MKKVSPNGFTLVELMIVIAIVGILAGVAYGVYSSYIKSARAAEANGILADIRLKQEAYRATFHQYACTTTVCAESPARTGAQWSVRRQWTTTAPEWLQLGVRPDAGLWYSYTVQGGLPGAAVPVPFNTLGVASANDFWYAAMARQDFDQDSSFGCMAIHTGVQFIKAFDPCPF